MLYIPTIIYEEIERFEWIRNLHCAGKWSNFCKLIRIKARNVNLKDLFIATTIIVEMRRERVDI